MARYEELARQATFVASKVSSDVYGVDTKCSHLAEGRFKIGAGATAKVLAGRLTEPSSIALAVSYRDFVFTLAMLKFAFTPLSRAGDAGRRPVRRDDGPPRVRLAGGIHFRTAGLRAAYDIRWRRAN